MKGAEGTKELLDCLLGWGGLINKARLGLPILTSRIYKTIGYRGRFMRSNLTLLRVICKGRMARARCEATLTGGAKQPSAVLTSQSNQPLQETKTLSKWP